jgi:pyruvate,water dikinase
MTTMITTVPRNLPTAAALVKAFGEVGIEDVPSVGGKNASLGEMFRELAPRA